MPTVATHVIEQAIYGSQEAGGYRFLARSPGFVEEWLPEAQRLCTSFGERPGTVACPACVFAQRFGRRYAAIVQVADQGRDDSGRPGALGFHLLVLPLVAYRNLGGDPFGIAERFPPPWRARGDLPALSWLGEPPLARTVERVQGVLKRDEGPTLLGGAQVLVDGGRLVFERSAPATDLLRGLWTLLPTSTRWDLWPASFAFGNALRFDALVVPHAHGEEYAGYVTEQQAGDYPEGRYELHVQTAAEAGDQRGLDALFARRSRAETWRLGLTILALSLVLLMAMKLLPSGPAPRPQGSTPSRSAARPELPAAEHYPSLTEGEDRQLAQALRELAQHLGMPPPLDSATAGQLLTQLERHLGPPPTGRDPGEDLVRGPVQRRLRALLWRHGVAEYRDPNLNPVEMVERLQQKVLERKP
jgi:hypothetical protein